LRRFTPPIDPDRSIEMVLRFSVYNDGGDLVATVDRGKLKATVNKAVSQNTTKYGGLGRVAIALFIDGKFSGRQYVMERYELLPALRTPSLVGAVKILCDGICPSA